MRPLSRRGFLGLGGSAACTLGLALLATLSPDAALADDLSMGASATEEYTFVPEDSLTLDDLPPETRTYAATSEAEVVSLGGGDRYETVAKEALYAFSSSKNAIVASGVGYADSIAASALAGALDCPILLTGSSRIPDATRSALTSLGASNIVVLGGESVVSDSVFQELEAFGDVERLKGSDRYETQMEIYRYGADRGLWNGDTVVVASAADFADALSVSPLSFALKAPVFFCDASGSLPAAQSKTLTDELVVKNFILVGSTSVTSESTEAFLEELSTNRGGETVRLGGSDRYATSMEIAEYAVKMLGFAWDGVAFASGRGPYDSLGGGVVQGKDRSVLLLADEVSSRSVDVILENEGTVDTTIKFFGGTSVLPARVRAEICAKLGIGYYKNTSFTRYDVTRKDMAALQVSRGESNDYTFEDFYEAIDPDQYEYGTSSFGVFATLTCGYTGVSAEDINEYVESNCSYSEETLYKRKSKLRGLGSAFVEAAETYQLSEAYLLAHAAWESGWGCSELASGWTPEEDGEVIVGGVSYPYSKDLTYYNFFGIGAVDSNALAGGKALAVKEGWTSPASAILGAAKWISENYLRRESGVQDSLYLMKWDVVGAENSGSAWHEYCTGLDTWCVGIARLMSGCFAQAGLDEFDVLSFDVPMYADA